MYFGVKPGNLVIKTKKTKTVFDTCNTKTARRGSNALHTVMEIGGIRQTGCQRKTRLDYVRGRTDKGQMMTGSQGTTSQTRLSLKMS